MFISALKLVLRYPIKHFGYDGGVGVRVWRSCEYGYDGVVSAGMRDSGLGYDNINKVPSSRQCLSRDLVRVYKCT